MLSKAFRVCMVVLVLALSLASAPSVAAEPAFCATRVNNTHARLLECVTLEGVRAHQAAFQSHSDNGGGNRASGTAGYDASAQYVYDRMAAAGYNVSFQEFTFQFVGDDTPPVLQQTSPASKTYVDGIDYGTMQYSGSGDFTAQLYAVDLVVPPVGALNGNTSGCEAADFTGFPAGSIALIQRGTCTFRVKAENAKAAGAVAVIIFNEGQPGRTAGAFGTLSPPIFDRPVLSAAFAVGDEFRNGVLNGPTGVTVRVKANTIASIRTTRNVIAESPGGDPNNVVMAGGHLDSVTRGAGVQDNGTGSAALLEVAEQMANVKPVNKLRFAWWGAEENGLVGSTFYVNSLSQAERDKIALYLNFDMVGSPNHVFFIYDGDNSDAVGAGPGPTGSAEIEKTFERYYNSVGKPFKGTDFSGRSDYGPFIAVGIPAGGLFTGAEGIKTPEEVALWGGTAGDQYDPCYHLACDTFDNINLSALDTNSDSIAYGVLTYAMSTADVDLGQVRQQLQAVIAANPGSALADKVEDALAKVETASAELAKNPPDRQAAAGAIEGAIGDLEAAVKEGLNAAQGTALMNQLSGAARQLGAAAIEEAIGRNANSKKIAEAQKSLAAGDALRASGKFKDAVNKYKDALSKAEGA